MILRVAYEGGQAGNRVRGPLVPVLIVVAVVVIAFAIYRSSHAGGSSSTEPTIRSVTTSTVGDLVPPDPGAGFAADTAASCTTST